MSLLVGLNSSVSILPAQFVGNDPKWWSMIGQKTKQIIYDTVYAYYKMNTTQPSRSSFQKNPLRSFGGSWNEWMRTSAIKGIFTKLLLFGEKGRLGGVSGDRYEENTSLLEVTAVTRILCWVFTGFFMVFPQFFSKSPSQASLSTTLPFLLTSRRKNTIHHTPELISVVEDSSTSRSQIPCHESWWSFLFVTSKIKWTARRLNRDEPFKFRKDSSTPTINLEQWICEGCFQGICCEWQENPQIKTRILDSSHKSFPTIQWIVV